MARPNQPEYRAVNTEQDSVYISGLSVKVMRLVLLALSIALISVGIGTISVYAQGNDDSDGITHGHFIAFASFIASGVFYSASGWIKTIRSRVLGAQTFDAHKLGKSVAVGVILGIGAFIWAEYNGESIIVTDMHGFFTQVGINTSAILLIDKWLIGRNTKTDKSLEFETPKDQGLDRID